MQKLLITAAALVFASSAQANVVVTSTSGPDNKPLPTNQSIIYNFESGTPAELSGNFGIVQGSKANLYAAPFMDTSHYLVVPIDGQSGIATLKLLTPYVSLSFYWGSVDEYNFVSFFDAAGKSLGSFDGKDLPPAPANGSQGDALNNRRVNFDFLGDANVSQVVFTSTQHAFEIDDIAGSAARLTTVPEPTSWAMLIAGMSMVGVAARRRRVNSVTA